MKHFFEKLITIAIVICINFQGQAQAPKVYDLSKHGIVPNTGRNSTDLIQQTIQKLINDAGKGNSILLKFKKGRYDFHTEGAQKKEFYISNHDQNNPKIVALSLENIENVTIDGQGSDFIFHGRILPMSLIDNNNVCLKNIHIDFEQP